MILTADWQNKRKLLYPMQLLLIKIITYNYYNALEFYILYLDIYIYQKYKWL